MMMENHIKTIYVTESGVENKWYKHIMYGILDSVDYYLYNYIDNIEIGYYVNLPNTLFTMFLDLEIDNGDSSY